MTRNTMAATLMLFCALFVFQAFAMTANPLISRGKPIYGSPAAGVTNLNNGQFNDGGWAVAANQWIALNLGAGPSRIYFAWDNPNYTWSDQIGVTHSCKQNVVCPVNYEILTSANSTNGSDGQWTTAATITGNIVTARGHFIAFTGMSWVKMHITSGGGSLDEVEAFDISNGTEDTWFFPGTSISANTYKSVPPALDFAEQVAAAHSGFFPSMIRGGIPCINSTDMVGDIASYVANAGTAHYWAIEMGTNDAWGGTNSGVSTFKANMQTVITACKNAGITPILARVLATDSAEATWQVHPDFETAVDELTAANNLPNGPDLYDYFRGHPTELNSDGVHPNATGAASIQRMWVDSMSKLYTTSANTDNIVLTATSAGKNQVNLTWTDNKTGRTGYTIDQSTSPLGPFTVSGTVAGTVMAYSAQGLTSNTTYYFKVTTVSGTATVSSNLANATTDRDPNAEQLLAVYADTATQGAAVSWCNDGAGNVSTAKEITTGAYEGTKCIDFNYTIGAWYSAFGFGFNNPNKSLDATGYSILRMAYKGPAAGITTTVSFAMLDTTKKGTVGQLIPATSWTVVDLPIPAVQQSSGVNNLNFVVGGVQTSSAGHLYIDAIYLVKTITGVDSRFSEVAAIHGEDHTGLIVSRDGLQIRAKSTGTLSIYSARGVLLSRQVGRGILGWIAPHQGIYLVKFDSSTGSFSRKIAVR